MADGSLVIDTELDNDGFEKGAEKVRASMDSLAHTAEKIAVEMQQALSGITSILQNLSNAAQQSASSTNATAQSATRAAQASQKAASDYDKQLAKLQVQIDKAKAALTAYYAEVEEIQSDTDDMLKLTEDPTQVENTLGIEQIELEKVNARYADKIKTLEDLEAEYQRVAAARDAANQPQAEPAEAPRTEATPGGSGNGKSEAEKDADALIMLRRSLLIVAREALATIGSVVTAIGHRLVNAARTAASAIGHALTNALYTAANAMGQGLVSASRRASTAVLILAKNMAQTSFNFFANGIKKAIGKLKSFTAQTKQTTLTSNGLVKSLTSLKRLLITRIKRMFISAIFNNVREGLTQLRNFSSEFNTIMSGIQNSAKQLSGNIAVSLGNIFTAVEPIITRLIDLISSAVTYLNQFFALLSGKRTYTAAVAGADEYADAAGAAADEQKEWNNELYGFDELTRQGEQNKDTDSGSDADENAIQYEEIPIDLPESVTDWIERLKLAWEDGEWYNVGEIIAVGLNKAIEVVDDWINNTLHPKGVEWADRIAKILNGLTAGVDWPMLGQTLADGLNALTDIYNTFMYGYDWEALGKNVGDALNRLFDKIDWENLGKAFAAKWRALIKFLNALFDEAEWDKWGRDIGTAIQSWFDNIPWLELADMLAKGINGLATMLRNAIAAVKWGEMGKTIGDAINHWFDKIDWESLGKTFGDMWNALIDFLNELVHTVRWYDIGKDIGTAIESWFETVDWVKLADTVVTGVVGILQALRGAIEAIKWDFVADKFNEVVDSIDWAMLGEEIGKTVNTITQAYNQLMYGINWPGLGAHIAEGVNSILTTVKWDELGRAFVAGFNAVIGTLNGFVSTLKWEELGNAVLGFLRGALIDGVDWIMLGDTIGKCLNGVFSTFMYVVHNFEWGDLARRIAGSLNTMIADINWKNVGATLLSWFYVALEFLEDFNTFFNWKALGDAIADAINGMFSSIDWAHAGEVLSAFFKNVLSAIHRAVDETDWHAIGVSIGEFLGSIDWLGILGEVADIVWTAFSQTLSGLMSTDGGRMFVALVAAIGGLKLAFTVTEGLWSAAVQRWIITGVSPLQSMPGMISEIVPGLGTALGSLVTTITTGLTNFTVAGSTLLTGAAAVFAHAALAVGDAIMLAYDVKTLSAAASTYHEAQLAHNRETETALSTYARLYNEKGKETADSWAAMAYSIDTTGMSMDQAQNALAARVESYWDDVPQNMWDGFKQGWNYYFGENGAGLLALLSDAFTSAVSGIKALLGINSPSTVFAEIGHNLVAGLFQGITNAWSTITSFFNTALPALSSALSGAWTAIQTTAGTAWENVKTAVTSRFENTKATLSQTATNIGSGLSSAWTGIQSSANTAWSGIKTNVTTAFDNTKTALTTTAGNLHTALSTAWSKMQTTASTSWSGVSTAITTSFSNLTSALSSTTTNISNSLSSAWTNIRNTATKAWDGLRTSVSTAFTNTGSALTTTASNLQRSLSTAWSNVQSAASTAWGNVRSSVTTAFNNTVQAVSQSSGTMRNNLVNVWNNIATGAQTAWNNMRTYTANAFSTMSTSIVNAWSGLRNSLNSIQWNVIGHNMVVGLLNGVSGSWGGLVSVVVGYANNLISRIKSAFGIASPSKVFAEIGEYLDAGLEQGLERGKGDVLTTASNIANAVTEGMTPDSPQVDVTADSVISGMQAIIAGLSGIASTFKAIADTLTAVGGFQMPQIAAGTVVPYKTRIDGSASSEGDSEVTNGYLMNILSALQTLINENRNGGNAASDIRISINGHEVFQAMVDENNRAIQMLGRSPLKMRT